MKRLVFTIFFIGCWLITFAQTMVYVDPDTWTTSDLAAYKGQTITFAQPFYVCNNYSGLEISPRRTMSPTNQVLPGTKAYENYLVLNSKGTITLNGVSGDHRLGERIENLTVYVTSTSSVKAVGTPTFVGNTRAELNKGYPSVDMVGEHTLLVCAFNLEYYLVENLGTGYGPDNAEDSNKQHKKIMDALTHINADVFGFVEVEQGQAALKKLANAMTSATGRTYSWINDGGSAYGSYTKSGYIYCTETVEPYGEIRHNNTGVSNRKKMQAFVEKATGEKFIFSLNHFKAKSGQGYGDNANQDDGQGTFNGDRVREAESVLNDMNKSISFYDDPDVLVMGDLNAYAKEDPIMTLVDGGLTNLYPYFHDEYQYSYVFRGQAGILDHALANSSMLTQITGMQAYHINSDENDRYTYDKSSDVTMFRSSDHDPVLVGLALGKTADIPINPESYDNCFVSAQNKHLTIGYAQNGYYRIYDILGNEIHGLQKITSENERVNLFVPSGWYIVQLFVENQGKAFKVFID